MNQDVAYHILNFYFESAIWNHSRRRTKIKVYAQNKQNRYYYIIYLQREQILVFLLDQFEHSKKSTKQIEIDTKNVTNKISISAYIMFYHHQFKFDITD